MIRFFAYLLSLLGLLRLALTVSSPISYTRYRQKLQGKNKLASSLCEAKHTNNEERDTCLSSHLIEHRGDEDAKLLVITTIKNDDLYWPQFFEHLPQAMSGVSFHYALILESPSAQQLRTALELTKWIENLSIFQAKNSTIYAAWNLAIKNSKSEFISNLNVDDLRNPGSYKAQLKILSERRNAAAIYGRFQEFTDWGNAPELVPVANKESKEMNLSRLVLHGENPMHASPIWKRQLHDQIGLFNEKFLSSGDTEFWLRALIQDFHFVQDAQFRYLTLNRIDSVSNPSQKNGRFEWADTLDRFSRRALPKLFSAGSS